MFGEHIYFSGKAETAYDELKSQIAPIIKTMMEKKFEKFLSILYRIDVSEKKIQEISAASSMELSETLSEVIIARELKKVIIRNYFSEKGF